MPCKPAFCTARSRRLVDCSRPWGQARYYYNTINYVQCCARDGTLAPGGAGGGRHTDRSVTVCVGGFAWSSA